MGLFRTSHHTNQKPQKRYRLSFLFFLILVYGGIKLLGNPKPPIFEHRQAPSKVLPIFPIAQPADSLAMPWHNYQFNGFRVRGNGTYLHLGDRRTHLPASLLARFFPDALVVPSCLTQPPPPIPASSRPVPRPLPVRDDWPGFFGAPWTARINGTLLAVLHVYAPRNLALPVAGPEFQIYQDYNAQQTVPSFSAWTSASFVRGSNAVLYRVFVNGPVRCLDLVVQNGENNGIGHLYYQKYHHYYEADTVFGIQP